MQLGAKPLTAFGTPGVDDFSSTPRSHAGTKSVPALALQVTWLKGSFHKKLPKCFSPAFKMASKTVEHASQKGSAILRNP